MPNIEIRGLDQTSASELRQRLFREVFFGKPYYFDLVIEIVPTNVTDGLDNSRPYFYVAFTDEDCEFIAEIKKLLSELGDVQVVKLTEYIPKKEEPTEATVFAAIWKRPKGSPIRTIATAVFDHEPNPWLRSVLRKLVREGLVTKVSSRDGALYEVGAKGLRAFVGKYAKPLPERTCCPEGKLGD